MNDMHMMVPCSLMEPDPYAQGWGGGLYNIAGTNQLYLMMIYPC